MKKTKTVLSVLFLCFVVSSYSQAEARYVCIVTDPTGTPLNVRATPNGKIVTTLKNGNRVYFLDTANDEKGRPWAKVGIQKDATTIRILGWVIREFVSCYEN